jgi:molybdopterin/thiamine biosynthesis adenylyltransferase
MRRLLLRKTWRFYPSNHQGIEVGCERLGIRLRLTCADNSGLMALLETLHTGVSEAAATATLADCSSLPTTIVERLMTTLTKYGALMCVERESDDQAFDPLYERQIRFLDRFSDENTSAIELNRRLQQRKVFLMGLGGIGSWLAVLCARLGIRHIVAVDPDTVEVTNLNRQVLYRREDVGRLKVDCCAREIAALDPAIRFEGHPVWISQWQDLLPFLADVDLVFNPFGYMELDYTGPRRPQVDPMIGQNVAIAGLHAEVPVLTVGAASLGPLTIPRRTACYGCLVTTDWVSAVIRAQQPNLSRISPSFAPRAAITAGLAAWEAAKFLAGFSESPLINGFYRLDMDGYEPLGIVPIERSLACPLCGTMAANNEPEAVKQTW